MNLIHLSNYPIMALLLYLCSRDIFKAIDHRQNSMWAVGKYRRYQQDRAKFRGILALMWIAAIVAVGAINGDKF